MPITNGQMDEPGNESILPAPSAISASVVREAGTPATGILPQKKYLWPWKRRYQKK